MKDQLSGFLVVNVFRDFSPLTESIFAVVFDGDYTLPQMFPGDILPPVTIFTGRPNEEPSSMIFCLYKSGFGLIDRLVTFNLDGREWNESRQLTGWQDGLAMQIRLSPESHDSPVVANVDDPNGCRIFFCSVDIQRPMWAFNICCLDVETSCWHRFSRFYVDHFYAHQKINLFLTQDGRLLVTVKYPWDIIREIRLSVTPLQQLCWGSLIASVPGVGQMNADQLKQLGLPHSFLVRYHLLDGEE